MDLNIDLTLADGPDDGLADLLIWLRGEPELRGRVGVRRAATDGRMGSTVEAITLALVGGTVGSAINAVALYLSRVRVPTTIRLTHYSGNAVELSGPNVSQEQVTWAIAALRKLDTTAQG